MMLTVASTILGFCRTCSVRQASVSTARFRMASERAFTTPYQMLTYSYSQRIGALVYADEVWARMKLNRQGGLCSTQGNTSETTHAF